MEINVEKFVKDYKRMCNTYPGCKGCPNNDHWCNVNDLESIVPIVQKWVEENPERTYLTKLKENFPNLRIDDSFYRHYCVRRFYGDDVVSCDLEKCEECWNREVK